MVLGSGRSGHAVRRPGVDEVGLGVEREVPAVVVISGVPIARRDDELVVAASRRQQLGDACGDVRSPFDSERTALGEVVLHVDDEQRSSHECSFVS